MIEIGNYAYTFWCEAQGHTDKEGKKLIPFLELSEDDKIVWVKCGTYLIMQFAMMFNKSLEDNYKKFDLKEKEETVPEHDKSDSEDAQLDTQKSFIIDDA